MKTTDVNIRIKVLFLLCVSCSERLEKEKKRREAIQKEKDEMEREKQDLMMRLFEYEETSRRAERGETQAASSSSSQHYRPQGLRYPSLYCPLLLLWLIYMEKVQLD